LGERRSTASVVSPGPLIAQHAIAQHAKLRAVEPWRKLDEETVYSRYRRVVSKRFELPSGEVVEYEVKDEDDMVAVLALTDASEIVLVRQFRPGPEAVLLELPAGVVDPGSQPAETAAGELLEETGYVGRIEPAGTMLEEGYSNRRKYVFVAHACRREREPENPMLTEAVVVTLGDLRSLLRGGRMADVDAGYLALDHLGLL
jgi:ADP-ribose pyrophosphatase